MKVLTRHVSRLHRDAAGAGPGRHANGLRNHAGDQQGAIIVIVAVLLTVFLGAGALAIDLGSARASEQKAQSAADAAALAVSDAASSGTTTLSDLQTVAQQMAGDNDPGQTVQVSQIAPGSYRVSVSGASSGPLAAGIGAQDPRVSAAAVAGPSTSLTSTIGTGTSTQTVTVSHTSTVTVTNTTTSMSCETVGSGCLAIFAAGSTCNGDSGAGSDPLVFGGGVHVTGGAWSDGSINLGGGGSSFGALTYKSGCSISPTGSTNPPQYKQNGNTFNGGFPAGASPLAPWPLDYSADFPSCSGSGCKGPLKTPSYCTQASTATSWSIDTYNPPATLLTHQVYCAVGSGTPSTPSTWNGALTVSGGSSSLLSTFVAGSITVGGGTTLAACGYSAAGFVDSTCDAPAPATDNYPLFYATKGAIDDSNGGTNLTGDWFAPNGLITVGGGTGFVGFLQASSVNMSAGGISGDGPPDSGTQIGSTSTSTSVSYSTSTSLSYPTSTSVTTGSSTVTIGSKLTG